MNIQEVSVVVWLIMNNSVEVHVRCYVYEPSYSGGKCTDFAIKVCKKYRDRKGDVIDERCISFDLPRKDMLSLAEAIKYVDNFEDIDNIRSRVENLALDIENLEERLEKVENIVNKLVNRSEGD